MRAGSIRPGRRRLPLGTAPPATTTAWSANTAEPETTENPFRDVKEGKYYYKAVLWAVENGISSGMGDGLFGTNESCTRAQIATFLYKCFVP